MFLRHVSEVFWEVAEGCNIKNNYCLALRGQFPKDRAHMYAKSIADASAPLVKCIDFIDCAQILMQRPSETGSNQGLVYSDHKIINCLIILNITTPYCLMFSTYGPELGRRHDHKLLKESVDGGIFEWSISIWAMMIITYLVILRIYGEYGCNFHILEVVVLPEQEKFNKEINFARLTV